MPELTEEELRGAEERLLLEELLRTELPYELLREPPDTVLRLCVAELLPRDTELLPVLRDTELLPVLRDTELLVREAELPGA